MIDKDEKIKLDLKLKDDKIQNLIRDLDNS